jgi:hypothetical protein
LPFGVGGHVVEPFTYWLQALEVVALVQQLVATPQFGVL